MVNGFPMCEEEEGMTAIMVVLCLGYGTSTHPRGEVVVNFLKKGDKARIIGG